MLFLIKNFIHHHLYHLFSTGPLQESAVWIDETQTVLNQLGRRGNTSPLAAKDDDDPLGISNEGTRAKSEEEMLEIFPESKT